MRATELAELVAFVAIAEERSFRRAATRLNLVPSTLSHSLRSLEERLGVKLLHRTTRTVAPTEAGQALYSEIAASFTNISRAVQAVDAFRGRPSGLLRINVMHTATMLTLAPILGKYAQQYPDVILEITANDAFVDIVREGYDAGIRLGESLELDMTAARITPDFQAAVVGAPAYFARHGLPETPRDLQRHLCIGYRAAHGGLYRWEFEKDERELSVQVAGPLIINTPDMLMKAALDGVGLAYATEEVAAEHLRAGTLVQVLKDWSPKFPGFYLYYPGRRQTSSALLALVNLLRDECKVQD